MGLDKWKENARASQQNYSNLLNDRVWEQYIIKNEQQLLWNKIAFVVCGFKENYSKEDKKIVEELIEKCIKYGRNGDHVYVAFLFVCAYQNKDEGIQVPLIRVRKGDGKIAENSYFIDHVGRVYNDWSNFLNENIFDRWWLCVPKDGIYSYNEEVEIEFYDQTKRGKILQGIDTLSTVSNVTTSLTMLTGTIMSFTPLAPLGLAIVTASAIAGVPGAIYGTGRSISKLVDRGQHDQSISLANAEARGCWISTVASVLSFGNMASTTLLARSAASGNLVSAGVRTFCTSLNVTTISMNGIGILNSVFDVASKKPEDITALDILQLTTSIFFFTNSLVNFKTANEIVKDAQKATIDTLRNNLKDETSKKNFDNALRNTKKQSGRMHGSADFIRAVKHIDNKQDFFQALGVDGTVKAKFNREGLVNINNELIIHPKAFMQINETQRTEILKHSTDLLNKKISAETFNQKVENIARENRIAFEYQRKIAYGKLSKAFNESKLENVNINGNKIFSNIKPHEIDRLDSVLKNAGKGYDERCLDVGIEFAKTVKCKNVTEFCAALEYVIRQMDAEVKACKDSNPNPNRGPNIKAADFYFEQVYNEFIDPNNGRLAELKANFEQLQNQCGQANARGIPRFGNLMAAANHYDKHKLFPTIDPNNPLSVDEYFIIAREVTSRPITPENSRITQNGASVCITFTDPAIGAVAVRYDNLADRKSVIATLMYDKRVVSTRLIQNN
jgi:hypothetical protein